MLIQGARLVGFRNLADAELAFSPGVNLFLGRNGHGKTNLLEALDYPALARSRRGAPNEDLVAHGRDHLHVALSICGDDTAPWSCEYAIDRHDGRRFKLNGETLTRRLDLMGRLASVFFLPESIELVRREPELRRRFLDQGLAMLDSAYLGHLAACQRAIRQKTQLLRELPKGLRDRRLAREEIAAWNRELARHAGPLCAARRAYAQALEPLAADVHGELAGAAGRLSVTYRPSLASCRADAEETQLCQDILAEIDYIGEDEIRRGHPLAGPHRDDLEVRLDGRDLKAFGSQGETRTAAVSLILAQSDVVFQKRRIRPVLFLDDIFSELDGERARSLQERCARNHQVFVATARPGDVSDWRPREVRRWQVQAGSLIEIT